MILFSRPENLQIIATARVLPKFSIRCMRREQITAAELLEIWKPPKLGCFSSLSDLRTAIALCKSLNRCRKEIFAAGRSNVIHPRPFSTWTNGAPQVVRSFNPAALALPVGSDYAGMRVKAVTLVYRRHSTEIQAEGGTADKGLTNNSTENRKKYVGTQMCSLLGISIRFILRSNLVYPFTQYGRKITYIKRRHRAQDPRS